MKNRYFVRSRISEAKFRKIMRCFSLDLTALQIASLTKIHRNTISFILQQTRKRIAEYCEKESIQRYDSL